MFKPIILSTLLTRAMVLALTVSGIAAAEFRAGVDKSDIQTSADMWPIDGFTCQHDPLAVRVLLLDDSRTRAAIVVVDQTSISEGSIAKIKALLTNLTGISFENTIVVASHTFSDPHVFGGPTPGGGEWRAWWWSPRRPEPGESTDSRVCKGD